MPALVDLAGHAIHKTMTLVKRGNDSSPEDTPPRVRAVDSDAEEDEIKETTLSPVPSRDALWMDLGSKTNPMLIMAALFFEDGVNNMKFKETLRQRLATHDRFKSTFKRVRTHESSHPKCYWEEDPDFSIERHVRTVYLSKPHSDEVLNEWLDKHYCMPLDYDRPLWDVYVIRGWRGGDLAIFRIHHCIGDGLSLVSVLLGPEAASKLPGGKIPKKSLQPLMSSGRSSSSGPPSDDGSTTSSSKKRPPRLCKRLFDPFICEFAMEKLMSLFWCVVMALQILLVDTWYFWFHNRRNVPFAVDKLSGTKRFAWSEPISLADVKVLGRSQGATVNDILLLVLSGAMETYINKDTKRVSYDESIRCVIPVSLRLPSADVELTNRIGLCFLKLPMRASNSSERLSVIKKRMATLKRSPESVLHGLSMQVMSLLLPPTWVSWFFRRHARSASFVMSNVPGPQESLSFGESDITRLMFWVPQADPVGVGVSIFSYNGSVTVGVQSDDSIMHRPEVLVRRFNEEFNRLYGLHISKHMEVGVVQ